MNDSGSRTEFSGGALKETENKPRPQLIPGEAILRVGEWYAKGAKKYAKPGVSGDWNWAKGIPYSECIGAIERHTQKIKMGQTDEDHEAAVAFWANALMYFQAHNRTDLDDRHRPGPVEQLKVRAARPERRRGERRLYRQSCPYGEDYYSRNRSPYFHPSQEHRETITRNTRSGKDRRGQVPTYRV